MKAWGDRIRGHRQARGLSMHDMAERLDCSISAVSRYENGQRGIPDALKPRIAEILEVDVAELFTFSRAA